MRLSSLVLLVGVVLLGSGLVTAQQSLLKSQGRVLAFGGANNTAEGDLVPGYTFGEHFGGPNGFDAPVIAEDGRVFFRGQIVDASGVAYPTAQLYFSRAYFQGDSRANLAPVLRGGDADPSNAIPLATLQTSAGGVAITGTPRINATGAVLFGSSIWDGSGATINSTNDSVLYVGTPGNWQILVRKGDVAPGTNGAATYAQSFGSMTPSTAILNHAGQVVFISSLAGANVTSADNSAWFTGSLGNVQLMLRKGHVASGGEQVSAIGFQPQMNANGQVITDVAFVLGSGQVPVTAANDKALWLYSPGSGLSQLVREGDASPIAGASYGNAGGTWSVATGTSSFNSGGEVLISSELTGAVTVGVDDKALVKVSSAGQSLVMRRNDPAPGVPGASFGAPYATTMQLDDSGRVAFASALVNAGVTTANDTGIWTGMPGSLVLVAREGDVAPGSGGLTFGNMTGPWMAMNANGQILFANTLSGGIGSVWSWDPALGLQAVQLAGDAIEVKPGLVKNANVVATVAAANGASRPLGFANDGTVALRVGFADFSSAIMTVRIGSLTAIPAKISAATGGIHQILLNAGAAHAGQYYVVAGSSSGVNPGIQIGIFNVPLNADWYTDYTLANINVGPFVDTFGLLDADGRGTAQIVIPPALTGFAGAVVHHAYAVLDLGGNMAFASESAALTITQ